MGRDLSWINERDFVPTIIASVRKAFEDAETQKKYEEWKRNMADGTADAPGGTSDPGIGRSVQRIPD